MNYTSHTSSLANVLKFHRHRFVVMLPNFSQTIMTKEITALETKTSQDVAFSYSNKTYDTFNL